MRRRRVIAGVLAIACASCSRGAKVAPNDAAPAAVMEAGAPDAAAPKLRDGALWERARSSGDPIDVRRLAEAVSASELIEVAEEGGGDAETALAALPFAEDAAVAAERLAKLAERGRDRARVLTAILGIAGQPRKQREELDPSGERACAEAMIRMSKDSKLPREERAIALSAARAFAEKGIVPAAAVSTDLE